MARPRCGGGPSAVLVVKMGWCVPSLRYVGSFLTAIVADIDTRTGACRYANAGHPPPPIVGHGRRTWAPTGPLFGPFPSGWRTATDVLGPDEKQLLERRG